ncbi:hypothetical protein ACHAXS_014068 [Conticribra weissflogii]
MITSPHNKLSKLILSITTILSPLTISSAGRDERTDSADINFEIGNRVEERLTEYISTPANLLKLVTSYRSNVAFPNDLGAADRDVFLKLGEALLTTFPHDIIYYALEDGTFVGYQYEPRAAYYREPGEGGYQVFGVAGGDEDEEIKTVIPEMQKHLDSCVDQNGVKTPCLLKGGENYIECTNGCSKLEKCPDESSQRDCSIIKNAQDQLVCNSNIKWCSSYHTQTISENESSADRRGYIPWTRFCIDSTGIPTQIPGENSDPGGDGLGNCYNIDDITPVNRQISGDYAYCGGNGTICDNTFVGGFDSLNYDPRYRPWYTATKERQEPNWSEPYVFFQNSNMGISYSHPFYDVDDEGRVVFAGVVAVDFTLSEISSFLIENYKEGGYIVAIVEEAEPNYIIATSTGSTSLKSVLIDDQSQPCPFVKGHKTVDICTTVKIPVNEMDQSPMDQIISKSFGEQKKHSFPEYQLLPVNTGEDDLGTVYASQTRRFTDYGGIDWRIIIMSPVPVEGEDTILPGDGMFLFLLVPSIVGFIVCSLLLFLFMKHRSKKEIIACDWRFTGAFILGCALFNLSNLALMGPNTDALCLTRMWTSNFFFVLALSPLFVKTYRLFKLVGDETTIPKRQTITHSTTALMMVPFVLVEVMILMVFTFVDPSKMEERMEYDNLGVTHRIICSHETGAFFVVQLIYQGGLVLIGCFLGEKVEKISSEWCCLQYGTLMIFATISYSHCISL